MNANTIAKHDAILARWKAAYSRANNKCAPAVSWSGRDWYRIDGQHKNTRISEFERMAANLEARAP